MVSFVLKPGFIYQLEYSLSGLNAYNTPLHYIFSNIDINKLNNDSSYAKFVLDQLSQSEKTLQNSNLHSTYFRIANNSLNDYSTLTDPTEIAQINNYFDQYVFESKPLHDGNSGR